jgi:CDGSH-type Zn-finger protein
VHGGAVDRATRAFCRRGGRSKRQPFCDGSHKGSEFTPAKFTISEAQKLWLCGCKRTAGRPFCDGSHKKLPVES